VIDEHRRVIVGATVTGTGIQEIVHSAAIAIVGAVTLEQLWHAVPAFPTVSEGGCTSSRPTASRQDSKERRGPRCRKSRSRTS
jgi:hypothetical protein